MRTTISIIGGGSCALMLACELDSKKYDVTIYERNSALGRKFLVAGDGGLNLTHSEETSNFLSRYSPSGFLKIPFESFNNKHLADWFNRKGIETFTGTSGRVFPKKSIKPIEVLNAIVKGIKNNSINIKYKHEWIGFKDDGELLFKSEEKQIEVKSDIIIYCLGGASWQVTGSKGDWANYFENRGVSVVPFQASNCSYGVAWKPEFISKADGKAVKNISVSCADKRILGEIVITRFGLEGSGIYPLSPVIRDGLSHSNEVIIEIDFKPTVSPEALTAKLANTTSRNITEALRSDVNLTDAQIHLIKCYVTKEDFTDISKLVYHIKNFKIKIISSAPIDEAISTVGGVCLNEIDENFQLVKLPGHYVIGEMLDYDAPTGGYLLQSCFTMAKFLADHLNISS